MNWFPIHTSVLIANVALGFDLYLHISEKYILYIKRSDAIEESRLQKIQQTIPQAFIDEKDRKAFENYLDQNAARALSDPKMSGSAKARAITGQSKAAIGGMFANPDSKENYTKTQAAAANQVALVTKQPSLVEQMIKEAAFDKTTYQHSVNVSTLAIALAHQMGAPESVCQVIGTGALLHDIAKGSASAKKLEAMTPAEREAYEQHPRAGAGVLVSKKYISKDVLDIIVFHEERIDGKGFPSGVKKLDQIFQVVGLVNMYDRLVTFEGMAPADAHTLIASMNPLPYDSDLIDSLKDVLVASKIC